MPLTPARRPAPQPPRPRKSACLALALALALVPAGPAVQAQVRLPALGESAAEDFNVGTERRLGEQVMREIRRDPDYLDDPLLLEYLQSLWRPLVAAARQRGDIDADTDTTFAWEAFLVRDRSVNAFALPGGYVGVHLGLIAMTASPDELASVLAHELSHVTQRHIARSMVNAQRQTLVSVAALLLGIIAASRSNSPDMANAAIMGGQAAALQGQLNFSRDMEREADRIGAGVLGGAGFQLAGMAAMFDKLDSANRLNDSGAFPYLRSHPLTVERIGEARSRVAPGTPAPPQQALHALMQARARVLMDPGVQSLQRLQDARSARADATGLDRLSTLYASALASSQVRDTARSDTALADARKLAGGDAEVAVLDLLDAETRLARGDAAGAVQVLDRLGSAAPPRPTMLLRAQAALALRDATGPAALRSSTEALQSWVTVHRDDATAWTLLGTCAEAQGQRLRALRAHAEARAALGDLTGALDRLRAGRALSRQVGSQDFIEASIIEARLRELEGLRRQLAAEARGNSAPRGEDDPQRQ